MSMINNGEEFLLDEEADIPVVIPEDPSFQNAKAGTIKVVRNQNDVQIVVRKQTDGSWVVKGGAEDLYADLTPTKKGGRISNMANTKKDLIPDSDGLFDAGFNVLLIGLHGTGKTESIKQLAERRGLKMKYFSCSTLDPFTDLVGVPVPTDLLDAEGNPTGEQYLKMVRPRDIDEADLIFFDELNRADAKTLNAIFEIIQFRSINGDPLPNLKACWGAINPPDEDYDVERLDAALLDRFDVYINIEPKPSISYMSQYIAPQYARALYNWWNEHKIAKRRDGKDEKTDYISPRRLLKIGLVWQQFQNLKLLKASLPQGGDFDHMKLVKELRAASESIREVVDIPEDDEDAIESDASESALGSAPHKGITYQNDWMRLHTDKVVKILEDHPGHYETHNAVAKTLSNGVGGVLLVQNYSKILNALTPSVLEGLVNGFVAAKQSHMRTGMKSIQKDNPNETAKLTNLYKALGGKSLLGF